jgi:myo-inositol-1(or 4)-monophosphatase
MRLATELSAARAAAAAAADLLRRHYRLDAGVETEAGRDIKTRADTAAEDCIRSHLADTGIEMLAEESAPREAGGDAGIRWIVDPLDGTMNFVRGLPLCAVSIGLWEGNEPLLGVVHDIPADRVFSGIVGDGAWCDDAPIRVSTTPDVGRSVIATGFPTHRDHGRDSLLRFIDRIRAFKKVRMLGSAALSLAHVAAGHIDAYVEEKIMLWDVAAGLAIVKAAGGDIVVRHSGLPHACNTAATNGLIPPAGLLA